MNPAPTGGADKGRRRMPAPGAFYRVC